MADASLLAIEAAIFAALDAQSVANGGVFTAINRWTGRLPRADQLTAETFALDPTATIAFDQGRATPNIQLLDGDREDIETISFYVIVSTADQRGADVTFTADNTTKGVAVLVDAAIAALNGLWIAPVNTVVSVTVTGTANATVSLSGALDALDADYCPRYKAHEALSVTLSAGGSASIKVRCIRSGTVGNVATGTVLTWSNTITGRDATATVTAVDTSGTDGLWRNKTVRYVGSSYLSASPSSVTAVQLQFEAVRRVPRADNSASDTSVDLNEIRFNLNEEGSGDPAPNPINQGKVTF